MSEEMNWKKFLTENVLREVWHEPRITENSRCSCGRPYHLGTPYDHCNRRYDNELDMIELYRYIYEGGRWNSFEDWIYKRIFIPECYKEKKAIGILNPWIFCLGNEDYKSRCITVAKFYGWKGKK